MNYLSVCSGIEAATQAWHPLGWSPVAFSEIEPFPSAVLAHHYPSVPNWGDMTRFQEWPDADVDVLVGGTPCQSFSVAGLRKGLADPRGNLMLTYLAIAERYRPRWLVSENPDAGPDGIGVRQDGAAYTLEARTVQQAVAFDCKGTAVQTATDGSHPTLRSMGHSLSHQNAGGHAAVAFDLNQITSTTNRSQPDPEVHHTLPAASIPPCLVQPVATSWIVRRLTPRECERLQGFPDDYTDVPYRRRNWTPDGPRYKALGNSMAVNVMEWLGERIAMVEAMADTP